MNVTSAIKIKTLVDSALRQISKIRKGGRQALYFCKCGHYKRKLELSLEKFVFHCWVCGWSGNVYTLFKEYNAPRTYYDETHKLLEDNDGVHYKRKSKPKSEEEEEVCLPEGFISMLESPKGNQDKILIYHHALKYLKKRGIGLEDICRYNIGYCTEGDYAGFVIIPSYDDEGKLNYFSSRSIYDSNWIKYKNAPYSKNVVGFECFINYDEPVNLVEGVFDAIAVRNNAVPLFGTSLPMKLKEQLILHKTKQVNVILDNDAMRESVKAVEDLWQWGIKVHLVQLDGKDPSEMGFDRIHHLIQESKPMEFRDLIYQKIML